MSGMKRGWLVAGLVAMALVAMTGIEVQGVGCASTGAPAGPPSALERKFFDITTNVVAKVVTQTNVVPVYQTNLVVQTVSVTNTVGVPVVQFTTNVVVETRQQTNVVTVTNQTEAYTLTPNKTAGAVSSIGGAVGAPFGVGGLVSTGITGLLALWAGIRNRQYAGQNGLLQQTAGVLTQNVETLRNVIETTPQGAQLGQLIKNYLITHQAEAGVVQQVGEIVDASVDDAGAKQAAQQIVGLLASVQPVARTGGPNGPVQTPGPAAPVKVGI